MKNEETSNYKEIERIIENSTCESINKIQLDLFAPDYVSLIKMNSNDKCKIGWGRAEYILNIHPNRKIRVTLEVVLEGASEIPPKTFDADPNSRRYVGCEQIPNDVGTPQRYIRKIIKAEFI